MSYKEFIIEKSDDLDGVVIFTPSVNEDLRGNIFTTYIESIMAQYLPEGTRFVHDKFSHSKNAVLRGIHGDTKTWKLVSCIWGEIFQVVVKMDVNHQKPIRYESFRLSHENKKMILIPPGYGNAFQVVSDQAVFHYKLAYQGDYFDVDKQFVVKWNDERLNINWPSTSPILQSRDT